MENSLYNNHYTTYYAAATCAVEVGFVDSQLGGSQDSSQDFGSTQSVKATHSECASLSYPKLQLVLPFINTKKLNELFNLITPS